MWVVWAYIAFQVLGLAFGFKVRMFRDAHPSPWVEPSWADEQWWVNR